MFIFRIVSGDRVPNLGLISN